MARKLLPRAAWLSLIPLATVSCSSGHDTIFQIHNQSSSAVDVLEVNESSACCADATVAPAGTLNLNVNACMGWEGSSINNLMGLNCQSARFWIKYGSSSGRSTTKNLGPEICDRYDGEIHVGKTYIFSIP